MSDQPKIYPFGRDLGEMQRNLDALKGGGGDGTSGGVTDDWKASVDTQLKLLHEDVRRVIGWLIAGVVVPLGAIIGLYVYNGTKFDAANARTDLLTNQVSAVRVEQEKLRGDVRERDAQINGKLDVLLERTKRP